MGEKLVFRAQEHDLSCDQHLFIVTIHMIPAALRRSNPTLSATPTLATATAAKAYMATAQSDVTPHSASSAPKPVTTSAISSSSPSSSSLTASSTGSHGRSRRHERQITPSLARPNATKKSAKNKRAARSQATKVPVSEQPATHTKTRQGKRKASSAKRKLFFCILDGSSSRCLMSPVPTLQSAHLLCPHWLILS
ncbi:uncharacterized protein MONBRDRAFT_29539 [Monosiga brevicollis MX1]|uniref:Uncharacterized protein n=1 Tax=Monosiga brevicollis TaxID=81824 RepID=A9VBD7_MONBE|nr:uncharacterized protein MONBRDRAFT_29539 [Monosiga brevicollis MX1]EDQ85219.1 predicted protein [Monosiga brevicollis MX1]|eukprot:XP_001750044.1 hypothetical protein [Monosiga brevicollis MX1]